MGGATRAAGLTHVAEGKNEKKKAKTPFRKRKKKKVSQGAFP